MRELTIKETQEVNGGILPFIIAGYAAYKGGKAVGEEVGELLVRAGWIPS